MAVLPNTARDEIHGEFMRNNIGPFNLLKTDIRDAVNALDDWLSANAATINNALPAVAKAQLSQKQKALLLMKVVEKRYIDNV